MDLNDQAKVTLTKSGALILNTENERMNKKYSVSCKVDYKMDDVYKGTLWVILGTFSSCFHAGLDLPFVDLEKDD